MGDPTSEAGWGCAQARFRPPPESNFRGSDVVAMLERVIREAGCQKTIRLDNGPEFLSKELDCGVKPQIAGHSRVKVSTIVKSRILRP